MISFKLKKGETLAVMGATGCGKTSLVNLIELRLARGMGGKSYLLLTGDVAAVTAQISAAAFLINCLSFINVLL